MSVLLGNLDFETQLARRRGIHIELPKRVRTMLASLSTLMAALGRDGDELWTIEPVDATRVDRTWLPAVTFIHGAAPTAVTLAWGDLDSERWNDRRYDFALAERLGTNHPGTCLVTTMAELDDAIVPGDWVVKAPLSASGRFRLRRRGALDEASRARAGRLLHQFGVLLFEPWVERTADYGCCGHISDTGFTTHRPHGLLVDRAGVFRGIELGAPDDDTAATLTAFAENIANDLHATGYRGPFGFDSYHHRAADGTIALRPFCEINARHSFGHIAWALADRIGEAIVLRVDQHAIPAGGQRLLAPAADDPTCAWWQPASRAATP